MDSYFRVLQSKEEDGVFSVSLQFKVRKEQEVHKSSNESSKSNDRLSPIMSELKSSIQHSLNWRGKQNSVACHDEFIESEEEKSLVPIEFLSMTSSSNETGRI